MGKFGYIPDLPDQRDFSLALGVSTALPSAIDLRIAMPPVYDQGGLGSCVGNAVAAAFEYEQVRQKLADFMPSRLFIYLNARRMEGTVLVDAGASIRDGIKSVNALGVCSEVEWPYDEHKFAVVPATRVYGDARFHRSVRYQRVLQSITAMKHCLASGLPIVIGFTVYDSFMSAEVATTGAVPMPALTESVQGGHAVVVVGYTDANQRFIVRNSWGRNWGQAGHFTIPYNYFTNPKLAGDLWTIQVVGGLNG